ncbi:MAG: Wzz/FepE/Etk N-terminal domain-containing protein [Desulfotomaculaceae bacterium]
MSEKQDYIETDVIDLRQIFAVLKKWRLIIMAITFLAVVTSGIMSYFVIDPIYEARSMLIVTMPDMSTQRSSSSEPDDLESVISTVSRMPLMTMNTYVGQLTSDSMYQRVQERLSLEDKGYTAKNLAGMVRAEVAKDSNIIMLKVQHTNPHLAADVTNALGEEYLNYLSERNQDQMTKSTEFIQIQKEENDTKLNALLEEYRNLNSDPRSVEYLQKQFTSITDDLNSYQTNIDTARMEVQQLQAGVKSIQENLNNTPRTLSVPNFDQDPAEMAGNQEINPVFISLTEKLNDRQAALAEKTASLQAMQATMARLQSSLNILQAELSDKQIKHQQMLNEIKRLEETQNVLAQKVTQTQIAQSIDMGGTTINIASPALVPANPIKPNKQLNIAIALVLGLMVALGLAFLLEFMDNTIKTPEDITKHMGLPVIGTIPVSGVTTRKPRWSFRRRRKQ